MAGLESAPMPKQLDLILVVDVEATCWEGPPPPGEENEIIEVGLCPLDIQTLERAERRSILVRPEHSRVSAFCERLTTLTQAQVETGITFAEACGVLREEYRSRERVWASYGNYDRIRFERQCAARGLAYPFGPSHVNVKSLCALTLGLPREGGMAEALDRFGFALEGTHHRGVDDAWNIARLLSELLRRARAEAALGASESDVRGTG
jgi:inhibitor of KinA sporulation pathway (predicted exonuclease)